ncbi:MAG: glycosyltransferase [Candidatus Moranbacteria bacterium]|nr:glycosyltransferase [Candidatus Moranbacteria bacterium]
MKLLINIPAFNEEKTIEKTIKSLPKKVKGFDVVKYQLIDDGSTDNTKKIAKKLKVNYIYSNGINRGLGITFKRAVHKALKNGFDVMVNIDADGQFNPNDISQLTQPILKNKADITIASRFSGIKAKNMPKIKSFLNKYGSKLVGFFLGTQTSDLTCGFRAYSRESMMRLNLTHQFTYTQETIIDALSKNLKIVWLPVKVTYFKNRKAKMTKNLSNFIYQSFMIIIKTLRDTKPLKFFGFPAFILILIAFVIFAGVFLNYIYNYLDLGTLKVSPYKNWLGLASITLILGIQFLVFAFLADMIKSSRNINEEQMYEQRKIRFSKGASKK